MTNHMNRYRKDYAFPCNGIGKEQKNAVCGCCGEERTSPNCSQNCSQYQKRLQKVDFALVELVLYLDAYPNCQSALAYYQRLVAERKELVDKLAECGMPQTAADNRGDRWTWTDSPWPWEYEANL